MIHRDYFNTSFDPESSCGDENRFLVSHADVERAAGEVARQSAGDRWGTVAENQWVGAEHWVQVLDAWGNLVSVRLPQRSRYFLQAENALFSVGDGPNGAPPPTACREYYRDTAPNTNTREHVFYKVRFRALPIAAAARLRVKCVPNVVVRTTGGCGSGASAASDGDTRLELVAEVELELAATNRVVQVLTTPRPADYAAVRLRAGDRPGKVIFKTLSAPFSIVPFLFVDCLECFRKMRIDCFVGLLFFIITCFNCFHCHDSTLFEITSFRLYRRGLPSLSCALSASMDTQVIVSVETEDKAGFGCVGRTLVDSHP